MNPTNGPLAAALRPFRSLRPLVLALVALVLVIFLSATYIGDYRSVATPIPGPAVDTNSNPDGKPNQNGEAGGSAESHDGSNAGPASTPAIGSSSLSAARLGAANATATLFADTPITAPYKELYGELGARAQVMAGWLDVADSLAAGPALDQLTETIDGMAHTLFPFLRRDRPLSQLRKSFAPGSKGIVIPAGGKHGFRFASHLIGQLRRVYKTSLPILVAHAGEKDFPAEWKAQLRAQPGMDGIEFMDLVDMIDDSVAQLEPDLSWATKPFALLAAPFAEVLMLDADAVLMQDPGAFFEHAGYRDKRALLYHDRAIFQNAYPFRLDWWRDQIRHPGPELARSKMWTDRFPEEGDSGAVVADKRHNTVLAGLLHAAWQNGAEQREQVTYKMQYGDKESYWFGLELAGAPYTFSEHYGAMAGWLAGDVLEPTKDEEGNTVPVDTAGGRRVCSFTIAHTDDKGKLLWLNGSMLLNKLRDETEFRAPTHWMLDGRWQKGRYKQDFSCMVDTDAREVPEEQRKQYEESIKVAKELDAALGRYFDISAE